MPPDCRTPDHDRALVFETDGGAVHRCAGCGALHIRLGTALLTLPPAALDAFHTALRDLADDAPVGWLGDRRQLHIGDSGLAVALTPDEVADALRLAAGAELLLSLGAA
jgi:hypothetical protein